jgi:PGF-pre-PGF domain-containing protein
MNNNGQRGIVYPIKDYVNTHGGYMLIWDLNYLKRNGWDISSHANHADLLNLNNSQIQDNLTSSRQWLIDNGFNPDFLAYPYNGFNDNIVSITKDEGYVMARTVVNGTFEDSPSLKNGDALLRLKAIEVKKGTTIDDLKALIDHTKSTNSTMQFIFHEVISTPVSDYDVSTTVFQAFSDYLKSTGIAVVTYSDYWNIITSVQPDSYIIEVNGVQKPETTDLSSTVSYSECTATKLYAKNSTYGTTSAPISIAPYCPNAVLITGIEDKGNYNESVTIILTPASPSVEIRYNLKNATKVIATNENYTAPIQVEYEGNYTLEVSGQIYNFKIDKTKPITTVIGVAEGQNYYTPTGVTINFNSIDNMSGVMTTIYHLDEETNYSTYDGTGIIRTFVGNHILAYKTYDKAKNTAEGTVNFTISNPPTQSSGGGGGSSSSSSSGGGGGVSMGSGEDFKNITMFESRDGFLKTGIDTTFLFTTLNQGIYQIFLNGESQELGVRVENLRGKQSGTTDAPDNVLLYTNLMVSSARIKDLSFTFKVDKNNITKIENVKAFVWINGTWNQLDTKIVSAGGNNAYFQSTSTPAKLTKLAISEIKAPDSASQSTMYSSPMQAQKLGPDADTTATVPSNERPKAPGFGIFAAILVIAILYVRLKR